MCSSLVKESGWNGGEGYRLRFNWKIYDLAGGGASFVLLAPVSERDFSFIFLFTTCLFCLAPEKDLRRTLNIMASGQLSREAV